MSAQKIILDFIYTLPADYVELLQGWGVTNNPPALPNNINGVDTALQNEFNLKSDWISSK